MSALLALGVIGLGLQGYGIYSSAEDAKERAKLQKGDIALQEKSLELSEKARVIKEDLAEAKVRKDLRRAQALRVVRSAISGTDFSSSNVAIAEGLETEVESGIQVQRELAGIGSSQAAIQSERLGIASELVSEPSNLDTILGYTGAAIGFGITAIQTPEFKKWNAPKWETDYSIPMTSKDF